VDVCTTLCLAVPVFATTDAPLRKKTAQTGCLSLEKYCHTLHELLVDAIDFFHIDRYQRSLLEHFSPL
jgi:hypothetical protein